MSWRFIHAADVHLDSPMLNLERYEGAPVEAFREAARRAVENLVELAIAEQVRFVLLAGDLYDGECRDINTPIALRNLLRELGRHGIDTFMVQGNHDAAARVTKAFRLELPERAHLLPTERPTTIPLDDPPVAIHGQGFATPAVTEDLAAGYPDPVPRHLNVGLLHTNCGGVAGHDDYAPSTVESLRARGYDYWALGHVHEHRILHRDDPWIVYPGNLQGRHARETGPKGCCLVTVEEGSITAVERRLVDAVRWAHLEVDVAAAHDGEAAVALVGAALGDELARVGDRLLAARIDLLGASPAHPALALRPGYFEERIREMAIDRFDDRTWLEKIRFRTTAPPDRAADTFEDALGELLRAIRDTERVDDLLPELRAELAEMQKTLPNDPRLPPTVPDLDDPDRVATLLDEAKELLLPRLLEPEEER